MNLPLTASEFRSRIKPGDLLAPAAFLVVTAGLILIPAERSGWEFGRVLNFYTFFLTFVAIYAVFALGLNVHWGYTGILNFGVMAFFLVGAYTAAIITKPPASSEFVEYIGGYGEKLSFLPFLNSDEWLPFLFGLATAAVVCGIVAFFVSIPALRLREDYLAIVTIGIAELLRRITIEEQWLVNGTRGLPGIPRPLGGLVEPGDYRFVLLGIVLAVLIIVYFAVERGIRSPWGRVLRALREDELTTAASGKNVFSFKSQSFVLGAMIMGIGGALYAYAFSALSSDTFSHFFSTFLIWAMLIVGGSGNNKGVILGAYVVWGFWNITLLLQGYDMPGVIATRIPFIREFVVGVLILLVLLLRPQGLMPEVRRVSIWVERYTKRTSGPAQEPAEQTKAPSS